MKMALLVASIAAVPIDPGTDLTCRERTFNSAKRNYPTRSDQQVGQNRKNSHLCGEPTDWPYTWRGEGVGGNIKEPGDDEHPSPDYRQRSSGMSCMHQEQCGNEL